MILFAVPPELRGQLFDDQTLAVLGEQAQLVIVDDHSRLDLILDRDLLARVRVILTGWGCQNIDVDALSRMPNLGAIVHTGGSVQKIVTQDVMDLGVLVSSQSDTNAGPVAEYSLAMIILSLKGVFLARNAYTTRRETLSVYDEFKGFGTTDRTVGIIGASRVGRRVIGLLGSLGVTIKVFDPHLDQEGARGLGVELVELPELMATSDVVSIHAPANASTHGMITRELLEALGTGVTLINTARGSLVDEVALVELLQSGRISAVLDVTEPSLPANDSPLWTLPNVFLTPHVAGALGNELALLGRGASDEAMRFLRGAPLRSAVSRESLAYIA